MQNHQSPIPLTIPTLIADFQQQLSKVSHSHALNPLRKIQIHSCLQRTIRMRAPSYGYDSMSEYSIRLDDNRIGYIDVVWAVCNTPVVAVEIDSSYRNKSIKKLHAISAPIKVWIYYGSADGFFPDDIIVIRGAI